MEVKAYTYDAVDLLKDLIAIPSVSKEETRAADKLSEYLNNWCLPHGREGNNLWVGCPDWDNNHPTIMLNAHIDTVRPVSSWTRDPFTPIQEGDCLYGLAPTTAEVVWLQRYRHIVLCYNVHVTTISSGWPRQKRRFLVKMVSVVYYPYFQK